MRSWIYKYVKKSPFQQSWLKDFYILKIMFSTLYNWKLYTQVEFCCEPNLLPTSQVGLQLYQSDLPSTQIEIHLKSVKISSSHVDVLFEYQTFYGYS